MKWLKVTDKRPSLQEVKDNPIIVVKDQKLTNEGLIEFASTLGKVWDDSKFSGLQQTLYGGGKIENSSVVRIAHNGTLKRGNIPWHVDLSHYPIQTVPNRLLYSDEENNPTPTIFFNTSEALKRKPAILETPKKLSAYHKAPYETPWNWPVKRPLIYKHPWNDYYSFMCPGLFVIEIEGITKNREESKEWLSNLVEQLWDDDLVYIHKYEKGDVVVYDNYTLIHRREAFEGSRVLKRVTWEPFVE